MNGTKMMVLWDLIEHLWDWWCLNVFKQPKMMRLWDLMGCSPRKLVISHEISQNKSRFDGNLLGMIMGCKLFEETKKHLSTLLLSIKPSHTELNLSILFLDSLSPSIFVQAMWPIDLGIILQFLDGPWRTCTCGHVQSRVAQVALQFEIGLRAGLVFGPLGDQPQGIHHFFNVQLVKFYVTW